MRVKVADAAKIIGCSPQLVRLKMESGEWDLGRVEKMSGRKTYYIFSEKLERFVGAK